MRMRIGTVCLLAAAAIGLAGCRRGPTGIAEDTVTHLPPETSEVAVADWLNLPRPELAKRCDDFKASADLLLDLARSDKRVVQLLPKLAPVLTLPVFQHARFSPRSGVSLPPYANDGERDADLAVHLARHGDIDGALLLADPRDANLRKDIESRRGTRNYPIEWTRLIALAQFLAEMKLANGEKEGAVTLVQLHQQLRTVLDDKVAAGPLGAALLPGGRRALLAARDAWEEGRKTALVGDIDVALGAWGDVPAPVPAVAPGFDRSLVTRVFGSSGRGHVVAAVGSNVNRVFDLLSLPVPSDEVDGIAAFFDAKDKVSEINVYYRPRTAQTYPDTVHLAQRLVGFGIEGRDVEVLPSAERQVFVAGLLNFEFTLVPRGTAFGAVVRLTDAKNPDPVVFLPADPRDFGAVHFDRTFDQDRKAVAPDQRSGDVVSVAKASDVRRVTPPGAEVGQRVDLPPAAALQLQKLPGFDLLSGLTIRWGRAQNPVALSKLAVPLWTVYGSAKVDPRNDTTGGHLALIWEDAATRYTLKLPHNDELAPEFVAEDKRGTANAKEREKTAQTYDLDQRTARLKAGKPLQRLQRSFEEAPGVRLGMARGDLAAALPASASLRKREIGDGWSVLFLRPPAGVGTATPQQLFVRYGKDDVVSEIRMRYLERPATKSEAGQTLLARLTASAGAPDSSNSPWATIWSDLEVQKPQPALYRWSDDLTLATLQRDAGGAEVTLRDLPAGKPEGTELAPLAFCSRGIEGLQLGQTQVDIAQRWKINEPQVTPDGGLVIATPKSKVYEAVVAYFEGGKAVRLLAYHRTKATFAILEVPKAIEESWLRDLDFLGCIRRQDNATPPLLAGFGWHDDITRVRTFSIDSDQGPRLYTEWREWPVSAKAVVAKPSN